MPLRRMIAERRGQAEGDVRGGIHLQGDRPRPDLGDEVVVVQHADAVLFGPFPQLRALAVVGADGTWYLPSIPPTRPRAELAGPGRAVITEFVVLKPTCVARRDAGLITSAEALRALLQKAYPGLVGRIGPSA